MRKRILAATTVVAAAAIAIATTAIATTSKATETFSMLATSDPTTATNLIATGAFTAGGTVIADGKAQKVRLPDGTFELVQEKKGGVRKKDESFNTTTCLYTKSGAAPFALEDGTGAYKRISGTVQASFVLRQVLARVKGVCAAPNTDVLTLQFIETASGPVSLP
jgi:hypothetical protein